MARHMDSIVRGQIQFWIESHKSVAWIASSIGKPPPTIWRELLNHRIPSDKGYGCTNRLCAKFDVCTRPSCEATDAQLTHGKLIWYNTRRQTTEEPCDGGHHHGYRLRWLLSFPGGERALSVQKTGE